MLFGWCLSTNVTMCHDVKITFGCYLEYTAIWCVCSLVCFSGATAPQGSRASSFTRFLGHTQRRTTLGRTPLDEWSAHRRDFYLTTHNNHNRETSMTAVGFEPAMPASERPQTYALDRAANGTGIAVYSNVIYVTYSAVILFKVIYVPLIRSQSSKVVATIN